MNALKNTLKRPLGHKGIKPLSGGKLTAAGTDAFNTGLWDGAKDRVHNALQNDDLLFGCAGIVIGHKESSSHVCSNSMMDVAGGWGNLAASTSQIPTTQTGAA